MKHRLPKITHASKICIICEGDEEYDYLKSLIKLNVWNRQFDIELINSHGNGNVSARYQDAYQNNMYDMIFAFVDTDRNPYEQYNDIKNKINSIFGNDVASSHVVIFGNPCTMQIVLLHFKDILLKTANKSRNKSTIKELTGVEEYNAKKEKRNELFSLITTDNYQTMKENFHILSSNDYQKNSSNFILLTNYLESKEKQWIKKITEQIDY